jgi:phospholipid transport system substrate-binding protein
MTRIALRAAALALALVAAPAAHAADAAGDGEARAVVRRALDEALAILKQTSLPAGQRLAGVEEVAREHFDFEAMSKLVLARNWKRFSPEQQRDFVAEFQTLLSRRYGRRLERYADVRVEIVGERAEARGDVTVRTVVVGGRFGGARIDYRMRPRDDRWRAIDVVIEGVSLVGSYRSQFADLLGSRTPDALLALLRERNAAPAAEDEPEDEPAAKDA